MSGFLSRHINSLGDTSLSPTTLANLNTNISDANLTDPENIISVAISGGDFNAIEEAIVASSAGDTILLNPGIYTINNPITLPSGVNIIAIGGRERTQLRCINPGSNGINVGEGCELSGFSLHGASGVGSVGFNIPAPITNVDISNCEISSCNIGIRSLSSSDRIHCTGLVMAGNGASVAEVSAGGHLNVHTLTGVSGTWTNGAYATGASSLLRVSGSLIGVATITNGIYAVDGGLIQCLATNIENPINGIRVGANGIVYITGCDVTGTTTWDILVENANSSLVMDGVRALPTKVSIALGALVYGSTLSDLSGDPGTTFDGQLSIGRRGQGAEICVGEGDGTTINMHVFTNTNLAAGTWADETADASSATGSTFTAFPGVTAGNTIYFGQENFTFRNLKMAVGGTAIALGAGALIWEYWNGAAWTAFNILVTDADTPYGQYGQRVFQRTSQSDQIRWGVLTGHASSTLNGQAAFWVRCRISVGITTAPLIEQVKVGTNRTEINADGVTEYYGSAILNGNVSLPTQRQLTGLAAVATVIPYSANISMNGLQNGYADGVIDGSVYTVPIVEGMDTSQPFTVLTSWYPADGGAGDVELEINYLVISETDVLDGSLTDVNVPIVQTIVAGASTLQPVTEHAISIPDAEPGDTLVFSHFRDAQAGNAHDTYANTVVMAGRSLSGYFWRSIS